MSLLDNLRRRKAGLAIGAAISLLAGIAQFQGWLAPIDNFGYDLRFRLLGGLSADPRIAMIEIDDGSIRAVGEYPWPRQFYAEILRELTRLGSKGVLLDLMLTEPTGWQMQHSAFGTDLDPQLLQAVGIEAPLADNDDISLQFSMAQATLPMSGVLVPGGPRAAALHSAVNVRHSSARDFFDSAAEPTLKDFLETNLPPELRGIQSPQQTELIREFRSESARRAWQDLAIGLPKGCDRLPDVLDPVFPEESFIRHAGPIGFVAYQRQRHDGVLREVPIAVRVEDKIVYQLALATAFHAQRAFCEGESLRLVKPPEERLIPLNSSGLMLIHWVKPGSHDITSDGFARIPAARVLELAEKRHVVQVNQQLKRIRLLQLLQMRHAETPSEFANYLELVRSHGSPRAGVPDPAKHPEYYADRRRLESQIKQAEDDALVWLKRVHLEWEKSEPRDEAERTQRDNIALLHRWFFEETLQKESQASGRKLLAELTELEKELLGRIQGKYCLLGYTATGVADLVTTPVHDLAPGLLAHANILNMVLQNRFLRAASPLANALLVASVAWLIALIACASNWRMSLAALVLIWLGMWLLGSVLFRSFDLYIASLPAVAGAAVSWSGVTWYRQATEERARKRLQLALTQYTSPAIAAVIAQRLRPDALAPRAATVTCFFSDLEGFTRLSETLGPARTRDVLNPYLESTSRILNEHGAIVNKFVGDGVFAFFNAPIRPCENHASQACRAALEIVQQCPAIGGKDSDGAHRVRVGLSTGEVFVGDYGSTTKLDYTCIGDTVNLGSRLEQINKLLGTAILIDGPTQRLAGSGFAIRPMGLIRIPGRSAPAEVFALLGDKPDQTGMEAFSQCWARVLASYQGCRWDECTAAIGECRKVHAGDVPVALYARAVHRLKISDVPAGWNGALDLDGFLSENPGLQQ